MPTGKYESNGKRLPSVTTVMRDPLTDVLMKWAERGVCEAAAELLPPEHAPIADAALEEWRSRKTDNMDAGSWAHYLIETRGLGAETEAPRVSLEAEARGEVAFRHWLRWYERAPIRRTIAIERKLVGHNLQTGGCPDLIYEHTDGRIVVCDWKTSARPKIRDSVLVQIGAYALLAHEQEDLPKVTAGHVVALPTVEDAEVVEAIFSEDDLKVGATSFLAARALYETRKGVTKAVRAAVKAAPGVAS